MISIIVAMDEKRGIGKDNKLLFKIPQDMQRMKSLTTGHPLIMGRKTFESLGRLLPERAHIVITRDPQSLKNLAYQPHHIVSSLEEGIEAAKKSPGSDEIFIFGGASVYTEVISKNLVKKIYLTIVKGDHSADSFFPQYSDFKLINKEDHVENGYNFSFEELIK